MLHELYVYTVYTVHYIHAVAPTNIHVKVVYHMQPSTNMSPPKFL